MTVMMEAVAPTEPLIVMTRTFDAPREQVWETLSNPQHVAQWYGGHGFTNPVCEMDVRPGGKWHHVMRTPDGMEFELNFVFLEVERPTKLVWEDLDYGSRPAAGPPPSRISVTLDGEGSETRWRMEARFPSVADRERAEQMGFSNTLAQGTDRFEQVLKSRGA